MAKKIYISPSNQNANIYAYGNTNEMEQCNKIADSLTAKLKSCGFEVKKATKGQDMNISINESNSWGADLHLPIHTNAFNGQVTGGTLVMVYDAESKNKKIASLILNNLAPITPGNDYAIQIRPELSELCKTNCLSIYTEVEFHDTVTGAKFIVENIDKIAEAMCKAICEYYGVSYKSNGSSSNTQSDVTTQMYRVRKSWTDATTQRGAYRNLDTAKKCADTYASQGYKVFDKDGKTVYTPKTSSNKETTDIAQRFVNKAISYLGYNCDTFNSFFGSPTGTAWCAEFVSKCASDVGAIGKCIVKTAGAGCFAREGVAKGWGTWHEGHNSIPQVGDIISFTWNGKGSYVSEGQDKYFSDHVGIVEYVKDNKVHTVEGNANGTNITSTVCRKEYPLYDGRINGYFRPNWSLADSNYKNESEVSEMNFKVGDVSDGVRAYKSLIRIANYLGIIKQTVDSTSGFGDGTKAATLEIQRKYKLVEDGIAGVKTITALRDDINTQIQELIKSKGADKNSVLNEAIKAVEKLKI